MDSGKIRLIEACIGRQGGDARPRCRKNLETDERQGRKTLVANRADGLVSQHCSGDDTAGYAAARTRRADRVDAVAAAFDFDICHARAGVGQAVQATERIRRGDGHLFDRTVLRVVEIEADGAGMTAAVEVHSPQHLVVALAGDLLPGVVLVEVSILQHRFRIRWVAKTEGVHRQLDQRTTAHSGADDGNVVPCVEKSSVTPSHPDLVIAVRVSLTK